MGVNKLFVNEGENILSAKSADLALRLKKKEKKRKKKKKKC